MFLVAMDQTEEDGPFVVMPMAARPLAGEVINLVSTEWMGTYRVRSIEHVVPCSPNSPSLIAYVDDMQESKEVPTAATSEA
jgi:hypothetical protein